MSDLTRDDLNDLRDTLTARMETGFVQINTRLDTMNGRVSHNEQDIAVLKDRSEQDRIHAKAEGKAAGQLWGGVGALCAGAASAAASWWLGK